MTLLKPLTVLGLVYLGGALLMFLDSSAGVAIRDNLHAVVETTVQATIS